MKKPMQWLATWLAWLALAGTAWAGYDARVSELRDQLAKAQIQDPQEHDTLQKAIEDYASTRSQALDELVRIVDESSASNTEQERRWTDRVSSAKGDLAKLIGDSLRSTNTPTAGALAFRQIVLTDEDKFWSVLQVVKAAEARDQIVDNHQKLEQMKGILDEKWRSLLENDKSLDDGEKSVVEDLNKLIDDGTAQAASQRAQLADRFARIVDFLAKFPRPSNLDDRIEAIAQIIGGGAEWWLTYKAKFGELQNRYRGYIESERGGILVLYAGFRRDTQDFIDKNGFDRMKKRYEEARSKLDDWRSSLPTSGQKRDGDDFAREVLAKLSNHLSGTENVFNDFVKDHQGKFFGPIGPDIKEQLIERRIWEDRVRTLEGKDLDSRLREWRSNVDNFWYVDMSGLTSADRDWLKGEIKDRVEKLIQAEEPVQVQMSAKEIRTLFDRINLENDLK